MKPLTEKELIREIEVLVKEDIQDWVNFNNTNSSVQSGNGEIDRVYIDPDTKKLMVGSGNHTEELKNLDAVDLMTLLESLDDELHNF